MTATAHDFDTTEDRTTAVLPSAGFRAGIRRGVYPVVPDAVQAALGARERLESLLQTLYADAPRRADLGGQLLGELTAGTDPDQALAAAVDAQVDLDRRDAAAGIIQGAQRGAENHLRATIGARLPEILAGLRAQLEEVVTTLRKAYADAGTLDVHAPDPMEVAQATKKQRDALVIVAEQTKLYRRIRLAQRDALVASDLRVPGDDGLRITSWREFFATGLHEVSAPGGYGLPGADAAPRNAVRAVVERPDVWLPDPDAMAEAYEQLQIVLHAQAAEVREAAARRAAKLAEDSRLGRPAPSSGSRVTVGGATAAAMGLSYDEASHLGELRSSRR